MATRAVLIAHREPLIAEALASALERYQQLLPVGVISSTEPLRLPQKRIDAAAVDSQMPGSQDLARALRRRGIRVILFGAETGEETGVSVSVTDSIAALAAALIPGLPLRAPGTSVAISAREQEILLLAARGMAGKQIAGQLGISSKTVEAHKSRAFKKLGVPNQAAAISLLTAAGPTLAMGTR